MKLIISEKEITELNKVVEIRKRNLEFALRDPNGKEYQTETYADGHFEFEVPIVF